MRKGSGFFSMVCVAVFALLMVSNGFGYLSWSETTPLPNNRQMHGAVGHNGYVYVIGGNSNEAVTEDGADGNGDVLSVIYAPVQGDGTLGSWSYTSNLLPNEDGGDNNFTYTGCNCCAYNGYIYIGGGNTNSAEANRTVVTYAQQLGGGDLGAWQTSTSWPGNGEAINVSVIANGYFYHIGGRDNAGAFSQKIYYAPINPDGSLGSWSTNSVDYPEAEWFFGGVAIGDYIISMGGLPHTGGDPWDQSSDKVWSAKVNTDGSISAWTEQTSLPRKNMDFAIAAADSRVYVMGGRSIDDYIADVYGAEVVNGTISEWNMESALPLQLRRAPGASSGPYIYYIAGRDYTATEQYQKKVYFADTTPSLGVSAPWTLYE